MKIHEILALTLLRFICAFHTSLSTRSAYTGFSDRSNRHGWRTPSPGRFSVAVDADAGTATAYGMKDTAVHIGATPITDKRGCSDWLANRSRHCRYSRWLKFYKPVTLTISRVFNRYIQVVGK